MSIAGEIRGIISEFDAIIHQSSTTAEDDERLDVLESQGRKIYDQSTEAQRSENNVVFIFFLKRLIFTRD